MARSMEPPGRDGDMSPSAYVLMIVIPGILWGGFVFCLLVAARREKQKKKKEEKGDGHLF